MEEINSFSLHYQLWLFIKRISTYTYYTMKAVKGKRMMSSFNPKIILNLYVQCNKSELVEINQAHNLMHTLVREIICGARTSWQPFSSSNMFTQSSFVVLMRMIGNFPFFFVQGIRREKRTVPSFSWFTRNTHSLSRKSRWQWQKQTIKV